MNDKPLGGRRVFHWCGFDRTSDTAALIAAVAETVPGLCSRDGQIARLTETGDLEAINLQKVKALIDQHLCGMRIVRGDNGAGFKREYFTFTFETPYHQGPPTWETGLRKASRSSGPDGQVLRDIYDTLARRLPIVVE
jgi:hypothetical protein